MRKVEPRTTDALTVIKRCREERSSRHRNDRNGIIVWEKGQVAWESRFGPEMGKQFSDQLNHDGPYKARRRSYLNPSHT